MLRVSFSGTDDSVAVAESVGSHTHDPVQATALTEDTKKAVRELSQTGLAPLQILRVLEVSFNIVPGTCFMSKRGKNLKELFIHCHKQFI